MAPVFFFDAGEVTPAAFGIGSTEVISCLIWAIVGALSLGFSQKYVSMPVLAGVM